MMQLDMGLILLSSRAGRLWSSWSVNRANKMGNVWPDASGAMIFYQSLIFRCLICT